VIVIITDDQGYGDLGIHGNAKVRTPHLDHLALKGVRFRQFYVSPVCSPTRASLLTGRYNYRTGVVDTFLGRSLMNPDEVTLAERLRAAGYRTGIFGKWHLGDNTPLRPLDQGFQEALMLKGGGIGQPSDLPAGSHYLDPVLLRNGSAQRCPGYISDVLTAAAIDFLNNSAGRPFFLCLAFNCPHDPLEAPEAELATYRGARLAADEFPAAGNPLPSRLNEHAIARVYAMVTTIDANVGRLLAAVDSAGVRNDTIVVFLTDNGPAFARYNAGLRGLKTSVYEGGIRVPCFVRWPGRLAPGREVTQPAAHIDLTPTLLEACGVTIDGGPEMDGRSLLPLLEGNPDAAGPERALCFQWHRGNAPEEGRNFAIRSGRFKLLRPESARPGESPPLELYDIEHDPFEQSDLAPARPELVDRLYRDYRRWFRDVSASRGYGPVPIRVGDPRENPTMLTPQDWRQGNDTGGKVPPGSWHLEVARAGRFEIEVEFPRALAGQVLHLAIQGISREQSLVQPGEPVIFRAVELTAGLAELESWLDASKVMGPPAYVTMTRTGDR
jgi:arylsulfatase A-like enzyme